MPEVWTAVVEVDRLTKGCRRRGNRRESSSHDSFGGRCRVCSALIGRLVNLTQGFVRSEQSGAVANRRFQGAQIYQTSCTTFKLHILSRSYLF